MILGHYALAVVTDASRRNRCDETTAPSSETTPDTWYRTVICSHGIATRPAIAQAMSDHHNTHNQDSRSGFRSLLLLDSPETS